MKKRLFIAFEGGEGAGKSTILDKIYDWMKDENIPCIKTREPGGIKISEQIRSVILDNNNTEMDERTEALLYVAARRQHLVEKIIPALNEGKVVLCDRFIDSSLAYQGYARGIGMDEILEINKFAIGEYMPNLSIFFDLDPGEGLKRINKEKNILPNITFHDLRHTYATRLFEKGVNPKIVQEILGHSNISITLNTYTHVSEEIKKEVSEKINNIFK